MSSRYWIALLIILSCSAAIPAMSRPKIVRLDSRVLPATFQVDPAHYSNILPGDYVGSETCGDCHDQQYELWQDHPHRKMNQLPTPASVLGDFGGYCLQLPTGQVRFATRTNESGKAEYTMSVFRDGELLRTYVVSRTVGSRYIQSYIGKQIEGPEDPGHQIYDEHKLPYSWRIRMEMWLPSTYFNICCDEPLRDGVPLDEGIDLNPSIKPYREICKNCHNTIPYAYRIFSPPLVGFQDARIAASVDALAAELANVHGQQPIDARPGTASAVSGFIGLMDPDRDMVSIGIGCESCHLGGREHVESEKRICFLPTSGFTKVLTAGGHDALTDDRSDSRTLLGTCTQCHSGNNELLPNGAAKGNSREALDLHGGFCATQLSCVDCHEPHTASAQPSGGPDVPSHVNVCLQCHSKYRDHGLALSHSGHPMDAGVSCLDCHMPRYTRGVDALIRSHRIVLPVESAMINSGSANACNSCHLDKSTTWTLQQMKSIWNREFEIAPDSPIAGKLNHPVGPLWMEHEDSHLRLMATQLYARSTQGAQQLDSIIRALGDSERVNRVFAVFAVTQIMGLQANERLPVDILESPTIRSGQIDQWLDRLHGSNHTGRDPAEALRGSKRSSNSR